MKLGSLKKYLVVFLVNVGLVLVASLLHATPVAAGANNETYTWKDYATMSISGGDTVSNSTSAQFDTLNRATLSVDQGGPGLTGDQIALFSARSYVNVNGIQCFFDYGIYVFKGSTQGYLWAPPPYHGQVEIAPTGYPPDCRNESKTYGYLQAHFHDQYVSLSGTRSTNPNRPERPEEKMFSVLVNAPDPMSVAPKTDTINIYSEDGKTLITSQTLPFQNQDPQAGWPPNQTPVALLAHFSLDPGKYIVCDTYVAKDCSPAKAIAAQKITKVKYDGSGSTTLGTLYETPDKKQIIVNANDYTYNVPCGSSVTDYPITVEITTPSGQVIDQKTNSGTANPSPAEQGQLCKKTVIIGLQTIFQNMAPGDYKICISGAACETVTKKAGEQLTVNIDVNKDQIPGAPPDQQVCTSGDGIAGALAWIICPVVELVAKATNFFENNIIIPFMTVSPLTTNAQNPIYVIWQDFRDLANIGFVILLFISIFSIALSRYGLKRVLPRLLIVAIGINLSYFIVAIVVDAFNILGGGISAFVIAALHQAGTTQLNTGTSAGPVQSIFVLGGAALLSILLTGGAALGWLVSFLGLAFLVIIGVVIILIIRQIAIIVMVMLAPLAILLYLLPNTESYFTKWRRLLVQLLLMYPLMVLLFAAGKVFGVILQQPDFQIGGDGVTDQVGQAVRVILQFLVYIIPLVFLPSVFGASGFLMDRAYGMFRRRVVQPRAQRLKEDASQLAGESKLRLANSKIPGVRQAAGLGLRRNYVRQTRRRNLEREEQEYLAGAVEDSSYLRRRAAGVSGQAGQTRAAAYAANVASKGRKEDLDNEMALLNDEMRRVGVDHTTFARAAGEYLADPSNAANRVLTGANGQTFDFAANETRLQRALLNSAAAQGEIRAVEAARLNPNIDQTMVDDIIRANDGALKGNGGYHLATNFNLASGRSFDMSNPAGQEAAHVSMHTQRLTAMANSGENSIVGMKYGLLTNTEEMLNPDPAHPDYATQLAHRNTVLSSMSAKDRTALKDKLTSILSAGNASTLARADVSPDTIRNIRDRL